MILRFVLSWIRVSVGHKGSGSARADNGAAMKVRSSPSPDVGGRRDDHGYRITRVRLGLG
jgi:hypothetical protein